MHTRILTAALVASLAGSAMAQFQQNDIAWGLSQFANPPTAAVLDNTIVFVRLSGSPATGTQLTDSFNQFPGIQAVAFDNLGGIRKNPAGNLLGLDFGGNTTGIRLYQYPLTGTPTANVLFNGFVAGTPAPAPLPPTWTDPPFNTLPFRFGSTTNRVTRGGGLSVSPDNTKLAFNGTDTGQVYVFDYNAATGAITGARATTVTAGATAALYIYGKTHGTAWLDNNTVVTLTSDGLLFTVDATTMAATQVATVGTVGTNIGIGNSEFLSIAYDPAISPYLICTYSNFLATPAPGVSTNFIHVIDPRPGANQWQAARAPINLTTSTQTLRVSAFNSNGDLIIGQFGGSTAPGPILDIIPDFAANVLTVADNSSVNAFQLPTTITASFNGIDVATGAGAPPTCYANCDGSTNAPVLNALDFACFLNRYRAGEDYANCDGSTNAPVLNALDFSCFLGRYRAPEAGTNCTN